VPEVVVTRAATPDEVALLCRPRDDVVLERALDVGPPATDGGGVGTRAAFTLAEGPFLRWERVVQVAEVVDGDGDGDGFVSVTERTSFALAIPFWGFVFRPLLVAFVRSGRRGVTPWWAPPQRLGARSATVLGLLASISLVAGYLGTLLSQTNTFFKTEFGASDTAIGVTLAGVRVGALLALVVVVAADRRGRRRVLIAASVAGCLVTATGALAPTLALLGVSQTLARAFSTAMALIVSIVAVEETPPGSRAFALSLLTMTGALGAGGAVALLWIAELGEPGWRVLYLVPLLAVVPVLRIGRTLPETRRFEVATGSTPAPAPAPTGGTTPARLPGRATRARPDLGRLLLLGASGLCFALFVSPAAAFLNEYLRSDRGFGATQIIAFQLLTNTPGVIGIVVGGRLADRRGRRVIGAVGLGGGVACTVAVYLVAGWSIWVWSLLATVLGAMAVPALSVYGPELFPTAARGTANGIINLCSVVGSAAGLAAAGALADGFAGGLGPAMAILAAGPVVVVLLVLLLYPETASRPLEELNPEDAPLTRELLWLDGLDPDVVPERWVPGVRDPGSAGSRDRDVGPQG
jgi:MFS family permease